MKCTKILVMNYTKPIKSFEYVISDFTTELDKIYNSQTTNINRHHLEFPVIPSDVVIKDFIYKVYIKFGEEQILGTLSIDMSSKTIESISVIKNNYTEYNYDFDKLHDLFNKYIHNSINLDDIL